MRKISTTQWWDINTGLGGAGGWTTSTLRDQAVTLRDVVAKVGLRFSSEQGADALALQATRGRLDAASLLAHVEPGQGRPAQTSGWDLRGLAALAMLWTGRSRNERELAAGAEIYHWLTQVPEVIKQLPAAHHLLAAQALFLTQRHEDLRNSLAVLHRVPPINREYLEIDLANPVTGDSTSHSAWLDQMNGRFTNAGLAPIALATESSVTHFFDRLEAPSIKAGTAHGPLVTVVVPCFRPDEGLLTSINSMLAQTYADMEIIIANDASGPEFADVIAQAVALDDRVTSFDMPVNSGSYLARRAALGLTSGEMITTQDADDWSHPQRIELQVQALLDNPEASASRSNAVRAKDDLTHQWLGYPPIRKNASSLMFRRSELATTGTFLPIRKGADSEYAERLEALSGPIVDTNSPLAITRLRMGSLSRGDFTFGWSNPDRNAFRSAYRAWHRDLLESGNRTDLGLTLDFTVPSSFVRNLPEHPVPRQFDLAYVGDFRNDLAPFPEGETAPTLTAVASVPEMLSSQTTERTALWHQEQVGLAQAKRVDVHASWADLVQRHAHVETLTRLTQAHVTRVVITDPRAVLLAQGLPCHVSATEVEVWLNPEVAVPSADATPVDLLETSDVCHRWFGVRPTWTFAPGLTTQQRMAIRKALGSLTVADDQS
ncbi:glycosyltransferase family 2 protein [Ornithinimicrobium sp. Arc0846-15]|nr:glycosyltransferase family 2 protein [Ornithinimicrobium laminariae]